jgi:hypothetical protein
VLKAVGFSFACRLKAVGFSFNPPFQRRCGAADEAAWPGLADMFDDFSLIW